MKKPLVKRNRTKIVRNAARVITRPHIPDVPRIGRIINRVAGLADDRVEELLHQVNHHFIERHKDIEDIFMSNFDKIAQHCGDAHTMSRARKVLLGAYFTMEYSIESAALFNPSMVPHPNQEGLPAGSLRFIMSLRATGEGHLSSIVFRSGTIREDGTLLIHPVSEFVEMPSIRYEQSYDRSLFQCKLQHMQAWNRTSASIFETLPESFTFQELQDSIARIRLESPGGFEEEEIKNILWLIDSNYFIRFNAENDISERVIFPISKNESRGIEDARFVEFIDENGERTYYATYTAYNGLHILPQLLATRDFLNFDVITLNGTAVQNKGMALFPRKIGGKYAMLSRWDGENNYIMFSDRLHFWDEAQRIQEPAMPWEFFQIGNCGSPLELSEGWLMLTHGVGPMRQYSIGAVLLDLHDPSRIIARLEEPLLKPNEEEREGYVPNVVYSCGALIHQNKLIIPYAMSDITSGFATVNVRDLIACMKPCV